MRLFDIKVEARDRRMSSLSYGEVIIVAMPIAYVAFSLISGIVLYPPTLKVHVRRKDNPRKYWLLFCLYSFGHLLLAAGLLWACLMKTEA